VSFAVIRAVCFCFLRNLVEKVHGKKIELMPNTASMWVKGKQLTVEEEETARMQVFI
jgi:hypothetical protein